MTTGVDQPYIAGGSAYLYPGVGDPRPPGGAKVHLLTRDGVCVDGSWTNDGRYLGWAPLPKRDKAKEALLAGMEDIEE